LSKHRLFFKPRITMTTARPQAKPWILGIHAYQPGKSQSASGKPLVKLSANENPLGTSPAALAALAAARGEAATYPDPDSRRLREAIAALHGLDPARVVCGTGSDELLNLAAQGFAGPGDEVLFSRFSFAVYDIAARRCGATPVEAPDRDLGTDVDALLAAVTPATRVVFLANPNNPTGTFLPPAEVARLHAGLPADVLLVIDEAYGEYVDPALQPAAMELAAKADNVLVTRTFSKIYGLAAERIGWGTGAPGLVDVLNRIRGPFNVTASGQMAALAALGDQGFVAASREHNTRERARLAEAVAALGNYGLSVTPSEANFLLVHFAGAVGAAQALEALSEAGYAVRHLPSQGLPDALRITIGKSDDMTRVIATLRRLCGEAA
jgi:histidinol-phosphate aminotransferase